MKIQEIIEENIKLKEKEILELYSKLDKAKEYYLLMLVDEKNIDSQYAKSIRNTIIKNYPKIKIMNYIITKENFKTLEDDLVDLYWKVERDEQGLETEKEINGLIFIQPSITNSFYSDYSDLDKLSKEIPDNRNLLPITSTVILEIIEKYIESNNIENPNILLIGNGLTVNKKLNLYLQSEKNNWNTYLIKKNFKTSKNKKNLDEDGNIYEEMNLEDHLFYEADIIVSATGIPESLKNDYISGAVISPTILYNTSLGEGNEYWCSDLDNDLRNRIDTNNVLGSIGKLNILELILRFLKNSLDND